MQFYPETMSEYFNLNKMTDRRVTEAAYVPFHQIAHWHTMHRFWEMNEYPYCSEEWFTMAMLEVKLYAQYNYLRLLRASWSLGF